MKKNYRLTVWIESELKEKLEKKAKEQKISLSEWCRRQLLENSKLEKIEEKIELLLVQNGINN